MRLTEIHFRVHSGAARRNMEFQIPSSLMPPSQAKVGEIQHIVYCVSLLSGSIGVMAMALNLWKNRNSHNYLTQLARSATRARKTFVDPETTSYYHCIGRCVRRAWLWGEDRVSGRNYEHRKNWVVTRLAELAEVFTLDVCAYAVMSNHYHLVVRLDVEKARALSEDEVIARYSRLFKVPLLVERYLDGLTSEAEERVPTDAATLDALGQSQSRRSHARPR